MNRTLFNWCQAGVFLSFLLQFSSCQLTKAYTPPCTIVPDNWKNESEQIISNVSADLTSNDENTNGKEVIKNLNIQSRCDAIKDLKNWWEIFEDSILNQLEEEALVYNYDLKAAFERVVEARNLALISQSPLYPYVNFSPSYQRTQMLILSPLSLPSSATTATTGTTPLQSNLSSTSTSNHGLPKNVLRFLNSEYLLPFNFQYEVDLWNKLHNTYYSAVYREQAATEEYYQVLLSLTSDLAKNYFLLRDLDFQYEIVAKTLEARRKAFEINRDRYEAGLLNYLDVSRAEVQVSNAEADQANIKRLRGVQENIIATLTGSPASEFYLSFDPIHTPPPQIPVGLPSELLTRRPDVVAAERLIAAAYAEIGAAYADFFPSLNLTASLGLESPISSLLFNWKARMWQIAANAMQLVFDAGRTQANLELTQARFREQVNSYQQTVLSAFQEVEDALINLKERAEQAKALKKSVKYAQQTYDLSYFRYNQGLVTYLDVTDAERELLQARQNFALVLGERYVHTVALIEALGGGWDNMPQPIE